MNTTAGKQSSKPTSNQPAIEEACRVLFEPGDVVELRVPSGRRTDSGYFDDFGKLTVDAVKLNRSENVYVTLNRLSNALLARSANRVTQYAKCTTSDDQITRRRWLPIDLDAVRPAGIA